MIEGEWKLVLNNDDFYGTSIFGNMQQRNMFVVYDLEKEMVSFVPNRC